MRKRTRIRQLEEQIEAAGNNLGLAQEITAQVKAAIQDIEPVNLGQAVHNTIERVSAEVRARYLMELVTSLPPVARLDIMHRAFADEESHEAFRIERDRLVQVHLARTSIASVAERAKDDGYINFAEIPVETPTSLNLRGDYIAVKVTSVCLGNGQFRLLDYRTDPDHFIDEDDMLPKLEAHQIIQLGCAIGKDTSAFDSRGYIGTPLDCIVEGSRHRFMFDNEPLLLGQVTLADTKIS